MKQAILQSYVGIEKIPDLYQRPYIWVNFVRSMKFKSMVEIGVFAGDFANGILRNCDSIDKYYMIDPWRYIDNYNAKANRSDSEFEKLFQHTLEKTNYAANKRIILRGKTTEVVDKIPNNEIDLAYIDGDHSLKGITIDMIRIFPKIKQGGCIGGDDFGFNSTPPELEPNLVYPFAVYFAEAVSATIYLLPYAQFLIHKNGLFEVIDLTLNNEIPENINMLSIMEKYKIDNITKER